jgi:hypothetical protein
MRCFEVKSAEATTEHRPFGALDSKSLPAPVLIISSLELP